MIRVLHIHTLPVISGSGINTFLSMDGLNKKIFEVGLACAPGGRLIDLVEKHHMPVTTFKHLVQPFRPLPDLTALAALFRYLKKQSYHIIHTHNSKAGFIGRLAGRLAGVPVIIHTVHGFAFHDQEPVWRRVLFKNLERLASHWCDRMIFISQPLIDWALRERITSPSKVIKIYSGIEINRFHPATSPEKKINKSKWGLPPASRVIGMVSKLWEGKGHDILFQAFRSLNDETPDLFLLIVGEGYLFPRLRTLAGQYGLSEKIIFTGFQSDVREVMTTFDVAVLPSLFEGMGRVLLEAMAMKIPVIASHTGGIPDIVHPGRNGLLFPSGDIGALSQAIKTIIYDKNLAGNMGDEGYRMISESFDAAVMARSIEQVYRDCLKERGVNVAKV